MPISIDELLGQAPAPQGQLTPLVQPQAPPDLPAAPQGPRVIQAPPDWVAGQKIPGQGPPRPFYQKPEFVNRQQENAGKYYDVRQDPQTGEMTVLGEHAKEPSEKEKPSYDATKREVRFIAEDLLRMIDNNKKIQDVDPDVLAQQKNTWAHTLWAARAKKYEPQWMADTLNPGGALGMSGQPYGQPDPELAHYFTKIGQIKIKLTSLYSQGRQSIWMTKFMSEHLPGEDQMPYANKDRMMGLLAGGMLDRAVEQAVKDNKGVVEHSPEDTAAQEVYEKQGMSPEEAYNQVIYDKVVYGDKAKGTTQGWIVK